MPNLAAKMDTQQQQESKFSTRLTSASNIREHDTEFLTTRAKIWIENVLEKKYHKEETVADLLADGEILYEISKLINELMQKKFGVKIDSPVSETTHFGKQSGKYLPYSHIDSFLKICKKLGLPSVDLFSPPDAVEKRDVRRVCLCIRALSKKARSKDLDVPDFDLVTDSLLMPTDMADAMHKYLEQNVYSISSKTESNSGPESKIGSRKNNEPFFTGPFEISPDNPDEAESKLKTPVLESLDSILGENTVATSAIYPVSPRSHYLTIHGSSSESSTLGGTPIRNSLTEVNTPLIPENDSDQKDNKGSRIKYTVPKDALNGYLEKSGSLTMKNSLTEIKVPLTLESNEGKICNEHPTIIVKDIKDPVNGELEKIVPSNSEESIHEDKVDTPQLLSSLFSFVALEGDSDGVDNVDDLKADGMAVHTTTRSLPTTNSTIKMIVPSIPVLSLNDSVDSLNGSAHVEGGHYTSVSVFLGNEKGINDVEMECKNVTKTEIVEFATVNPPKLDSLDAGSENVLNGRSKEFGSPSASEVVSYTNPEIVFDVNNANYYNVNEPKAKIECLDTKYASKGKLNIVDIDCVNMPTENILDIVNENVPKAWRVDVGPTDAPKLGNLDVGHRNGWKGNSVDSYKSVPQAVGIDTDTTNVSHVNNVDGCYMYKPQTKCVKIDFVNEAKPDNGNTAQTGIVDTGRANMPKTESMDVDCIPTKTLLVTTDAPSIPVLVSNNLYEEHGPPAFSSVSNGPGQGELTNGDGIYANVIQKEEFEGGPTNILDIVNKNVPKAWRDDVGPMDAPKLGSLDVGHENEWKGNSVDSYTSVPQAVAIDTDTTNVSHVNNVDGYMCQPQTKCVEIEFVNEAKPNNGNTAQTGIVDMRRANMPKTESMDVDCIPTKPLLVTTDAPSILVMVSNNAYEELGPPAFLSVSNDTGKGKLTNGDGIYANVLQNEEVECGPTNGPELDILDFGPKSAQKVDSLFCGRRFAPQTVSVDIDQCVNKERSDTDCGVTPKRDTVDMVNTSMSKVNSVDIKCTVEVEEEGVTISGNALEADNVDNGSMKVLKSETVVDSAANRKTRDIDRAIVTGEDTFVNAAGNELETDTVDHEATIMMKSEIIDVDSVMNKKTGDFNFADLSAEDYVVNAQKGLEADSVNEDCKTVLKSETVDVSSAGHMRTCNKICAVVTEENSVNAANSLEVNIVNDSKKTVEVDSAANMKTKINCSAVAEECVVDVGNKQVADNIDGDSINVLKPDIVDVDIPANTKPGDVNRAVVTDEICASNAGNIDDNSKDVLKLETVDVWSVVDMEMGDINCADVTEEDFIFNNDYGLDADNVDNDCKKVLKQTVGVVSALNTKTGYTKFPVVTAVESTVNSGNGLKEDINDDHSEKLSKSDAIVESAGNEKTRSVKHAVVVEEASIGNACSGLEANNFDNVPLNMMNLETVDIGTALDSVRRDIGCSVVIEEDHAAYGGKGWDAHHVFEITRNLLKLETFGFDSAVNIKTRDINYPVLTELDSVVNSGNTLEAENIYDYARNVPKLETDSSANMKTRDINGEVVSADNNFVNAGNVSEANNIHNGCINILKLETVGVEKVVYIRTGDICHIKRCEPLETPEENVFVASESRNQLKSTVCEHGYDYRDQGQLNETETSSPEKDETTATKHIRKHGRKRLCISLFACGFAVVGAALVTIQWRPRNRKQEEYEIKEGDTLSYISKRAGKSSWKELLLINPQIKNPDLIYPGQRLKLQ